MWYIWIAGFKGSNHHEYYLFQKVVPIVENFTVSASFMVKNGTKRQLNTVIYLIIIIIAIIKFKQFIIIIIINNNRSQYSVACFSPPIISVFSCIVLWTSDLQRPLSDVVSSIVHEVVFLIILHIWDSIKGYLTADIAWSFLQCVVSEYILVMYKFPMTAYRSCSCSVLKLCVKNN